MCRLVKTLDVQGKITGSLKYSKCFNSQFERRGKDWNLSENCFTNTFWQADEIELNRGLIWNAETDDWIEKEFEYPNKSNHVLSHNAFDKTNKEVLIDNENPSEALIRVWNDINLALGMW